MTIEEAFVELENYVDASDPDMDSVSVVCVAALRCLSLPRRSYSSVLRSLRATVSSYSPLFDRITPRIRAPITFGRARETR